MIRLLICLRSSAWFAEEPGVANKRCGSSLFGHCRLQESRYSQMESVAMVVARIALVALELEINEPKVEAIRKLSRRLLLSHAHSFFSSSWHCNYARHQVRS